MSTVLVTGGSGFIGSHCIQQLLEAGHTVKTTVRDLKRKPEVLTLLSSAGVSRDAASRVSFFAADLEKDHGWHEAVAGRRHVDFDSNY